MTLRKPLLAALLMAAAACTAQAAPLKYVFYFIGDGMGTGPVLAAQQFNRMALGSDEPLLMTTFPVASMAYTYSWSSPVTDSAAAGTALATGVKTRNGMVGMAPDTVAVTSVASRLSNLGWGVGIITSNAPDDATPAGHYAHQANRSMYYEIGQDMAVSGFDYFGGAPLRGLTGKDGKATDLRERLERMNYTIVEGVQGLADGIGKPRVVALNDAEGLNNSLGYAIDGPTTGFNLEQLTRACLANLEKYTPDCFFMMVEDGLIDHSLHGNDSPTALRQTIAFQDAIRVAYDFYTAHPEETLIVVTADHDTGGLTLGNSNPAVKYDARLDYLAQVRLSKSAFSRKVNEIFNNPPADYDWDDMSALLTSDLGFWGAVDVTPAQTERLRSLFEAAINGSPDAGRETLYETYDAFAAAVWEVLDEQAGIGWITTYHTGGFVPVYAIGRGAERFSSLSNNIDLPARIWDTVISTLAEEPKPAMY